MSTNDQQVSETKQQAIDWLVCLRSDEVTDEQQYAFAEWLAEDHSHSEAFNEAEILFQQMTDGLQLHTVAAATEGFQAEQNSDIASLFPEPKTIYTRQKSPSYWLPTAAIAAVWLLLVNLYWPQQFSFWHRALSDYHTRTAEFKNIRLADGSRLMLDTNSAISVAYDENMRLLHLHQGKVRFDVAKDSRPFIVETAGLKVKALGTVFQVHKSADESIQIVVEEHAVKVSTAMSEEFSQATVVVPSGQQLSYQAGTEMMLPEKIDLKQSSAWQKKRLIINDQKLESLIVELERYRHGRIFLANDEIKNLRVSGVFSLQDPDAVLKNICKVLNLSQTRVAGLWSVLHR